MKKCTLTQVPCREAIMEVVQSNKDRRSLQHTYELAELFQTACSSNEAFMELSEEDQERFWLITDALMMNDLEDLKRVHNLANYLMIKRWRRSMDYKKELLEMIQKMENIRFLAMAYGFVGRLYQKEKERKK